MRKMREIFVGTNWFLFVYLLSLPASTVPAPLEAAFQGKY